MALETRELSFSVTSCTVYLQILSSWSISRKCLGEQKLGRFVQWPWVNYSNLCPSCSPLHNPKIKNRLKAQSSEAPSNSAVSHFRSKGQGHWHNLAVTCWVSQCPQLPHIHRSPGHDVATSLSIPPFSQFNSNSAILPHKIPSMLLYGLRSVLHSEKLC